VQLFDDLLITPTRKSKKITGTIVNVRDQRKKTFNNKAQFRYCHKRIDLYLAKARSMDIQLPNTLALEPYK
jgi:protein tyrosine phosphatase